MHNTRELLRIADIDGKMIRKPDKRNTALNAALNGGFSELATDYLTGTTAWAADGVFDIGELHAMCVIGKRLIERIEQNLHAAMRFAMPGVPVAFSDGNVAVCNAPDGPCDRALFERCSICERGKGRVVPVEFYATATRNRQQG